MNKVIMLKDYRVAINITQTAVYKEGQEYSVDDETLKNMIHDGAAKLVEDKPAPSENKAIEKAPENKSKKRKSKKKN